MPDFHLYGTGKEKQQKEIAEPISSSFHISPRLLITRAYGGWEAPRPSYPQAGD